ncbi:receiver/sensor box histidine kinase [Haloferax gibbonsii]|uniref:histidine kinase n=1 Tax=Haloferax gibbonsii TaxID=35746 RepID=A0A0K1IQS2_HALGI|nr:ATP-binding protein [Haloferax gibbonsii]AKU06663.1 histidine kinase [Haloferax gibbonsii]
MSTPDDTTGNGGDDPISVLYVGRDPEFVALVATALERESDRLDVRGETAVIDGISVVEDDGVDCVVSEYHLRDGDGLDLLTAVRARSSDLPFILYTAHGDEAVASRAISLGVSDYVRRTAGDEDFHLLASRVFNAVSQYRVQERLTESDAHLATVYGRVTDGIFALDDDWAVSYWNDAMAERTGVPAAEALNRDFRELFPEVGSEIHGALEAAMASGATTRLDTRIDAFDVRVSARIYPDDSGVSVFIREVASDATAAADRAGTDDTSLDAGEIADQCDSGAGVNAGTRLPGRDAAERERLERALRDLQSVARELLRVETSEAVAAVAVEAVRDVVGWPISGVWFYDPDDDALVPVAQSDAARQVFGESPTLHRDGEETLIWEAFDANEVRVYERTVGGSEVQHPDSSIESEVHVPLGEYGVLLTGDTRQGAFTDVDVELLQLLASTVSSAVERAKREQTLRDREAELAAANERLDEFVSVVAHDLRNPLSVAKGYLEIAADTGDPEHFEKIETALERMNALISDLLTLARQGSPVTEFEAVDLRSKVTHAWSFVATEDARLEPLDLGVVRADTGRLLQLFENLFRNAVEHGSTGSRTPSDDAVEHGSTGNQTTSGDAVEHGGAAATVTVGRLDDDAGFYVEDDGDGIPESLRERVFEHGYTTDRTGTGFGLAIVENIAEAHGWSVTLTDGTDGGARFEFRGVEWVDIDDAE